MQESNHINQLNIQSEKMDEISMYHFVKNQMHINDEYYDYICDREIFLIKKAMVYTIIAPFASMLFLAGLLCI